VRGRLGAVACPGPTLPRLSSAHRSLKWLPPLRGFFMLGDSIPGVGTRWLLTVAAFRLEYDSGVSCNSGEP